MYDAGGRVTAKGNALDEVTFYRYDGADRRIAQQDALGHVSTSV